MKHALLNNRFAHVAILAAVMAWVTLPNLESVSLWDMDEGVNAQCTIEMMNAGTWVVPTFNDELRTAKPVMLYWLQRASVNLFGINEWALRFPSVLISFGTLLLVYELGRRMIAPAAGLLAGMILATSFEFVKLAHAATPDAAFIFFVTAALTFFWFGQRCDGRAWHLPTAIACGLATLTKGPAGAALPGLIILLYFAWNRELRRLLDRRLIWAATAFLLVAAPWYGLVAAETRGAYLRAFFGNDNINRFMTPLENHRGPVVYYLGAILVFFAPWSVIIGAVCWQSFKESRLTLIRKPEFTESVRFQRFLIVWILAILCVFSFAATKLPNYIGPLYPPLALLTAGFLVRWARGEITVPNWVLPAAGGGLFLMSVVIGLGLLVAGGLVALPLKGVRIIPDLAPWAVLSLLPFILGILAIRSWKNGDSPQFTIGMAAISVVLIGLIAAFPVRILDAGKSAKALVEAADARQPDRDIRLASLEYTQESVTFYAERRVERLRSAEAAAAFLTLPRPGYLFIPAKLWEQSVVTIVGPHRIAARKFDLFRNAEILVVTNDGVQP